MITAHIPPLNTHKQTNIPTMTTTKSRSRKDYSRMGRHSGQLMKPQCTRLRPRWPLLFVGPNSAMRWRTSSTASLPPQSIRHWTWYLLLLTCSTSCACAGTHAHARMYVCMNTPAHTHRIRTTGPRNAATTGARTNGGN